MILWLAPFFAALLVGGYGVTAYRLGLPSPVRSRHERALANIERLELELGYRRTPYQEHMDRYMETLRANRERATIQRNPYANLERGWTARRTDHDTVDLSAIAPEDRNPHQQDYA